MQSEYNQVTIRGQSDYNQIKIFQDESGGLAGRYLAARCGNPTLNTVSRSRIWRVSIPPCCMCRDAGCHNQLNSRSRIAPRSGRRVLSVVDNPEATPSQSLDRREAIGQLLCGGVTTLQRHLTLLLEQHSSGSSSREQQQQQQQHQ